MKRICLTVGLLVMTICSAIGAPDVQIMVAYYSTNGHTRAMAEAVGTGAKQVKGVTVTVARVGDITTDMLLKADAVILGSPVINGNVHPKVLAFISSWPFKNNPMRDKIGAAFTTAGGFSSGEEHVMHSILNAMLIHGMIVAGGPDWRSAFGASAVVSEQPYFTENKKGKVPEYFLEKGRSLGKRIAALALKLKRVQKKATPAVKH
jgi:NAD(P)H dehydrogenase (quinone)